nr:protein BHLHb9 isoform X2 [Equus caballus]
MLWWMGAQEAGSLREASVERSSGHCWRRSACELAVGLKKTGSKEGGENCTRSMQVHLHWWLWWPWSGRRSSPSTVYSPMCHMKGQRAPFTSRQAHFVHLYWLNL